MDWVNIFIGSIIGSIISWLITYYYFKKTQKSTKEQNIKDKLENLSKDIQFAYDKTNNKSKRKEKLQNIVYLSIRHQRNLLGNKLIIDLEDILFKNSDNKEQTLVELAQAFRKSFPNFFLN